MKVQPLSDFKGGWFLGNFNPSIFKTNQFEVAIMRHKKGESWPKHYHTATEINYLVSGKMLMRNQVIEADTVFLIEPLEVADPEFLEDCVVVVVKTPSIPGDKFIVD